VQVLAGVHATSLGSKVKTIQRERERERESERIQQNTLGQRKGYREVLTQLPGISFVYTRFCCVWIWRRTGLLKFQWVVCLKRIDRDHRCEDCDHRSYSCSLKGTLWSKRGEMNINFVPSGSIKTTTEQNY